MIQVKIEDHGLISKLQLTVDRLTNMKPVLENIGKYMQASIRENIDSGGRPTKWKKNIYGQTALTNRSTPSTGGLYGSIRIMELTDKSVTVGTDVPYAKFHQQGAAWTPSARQRKFFFWMINKRGVYSRAKADSKTPLWVIPIRRFVMFQQEDIGNIQEQISNYLIKGTQ
jgi:phage gpG-like protein